MRNDILNRKVRCSEGPGTGSNGAHTRGQRGMLVRWRLSKGRQNVLIVASILPALFGCSSSSVAPKDAVPPAAVRDLIAIKPTSNSITLIWTAPGDNGNAGTAARYDIRYSKDPLTDAVWPSASTATGAPTPRPAGERDTLVVAGLDPSTLYYFSLKTADKEGNWSAKSNIASAPTTAREDTTPPAAVTDLAASDSTTVSVTLTWTAPGNDGNTGTAAEYDVRYATTPLNDATWTFAPQAVGEPAPKPAGSSEHFIVTSLPPGVRFYFALKTADAAGNWSALSNVITARTKIN
jgi:hypothetical protein